MKKYHPKNERIKHKYLAYLEEVKRMSIKGADTAAAAIADFEKSTGHKGFAAFHIEQARRYKRELSQTTNQKTKKPLAVSTITARLLAVKAFFFWLAGESGYRSKISYSDCDYFNPSANDQRIARASSERATPEIKQIKHALFQMPIKTDIEKRNRALFAFTLLSGIRVDALASLKIKHVNVKELSVFQDAREVRTKFRKTMTTIFFPVGDEIQEELFSWLEHLKTNLLYGPDDPLFPATKINLDSKGQFETNGLERKHWKSTDPIRGIFRQAFENANLPYFHPHSFRHTLSGLGLRLSRTPEEFKAWSQNLSHEKVLTTFINYGKVSQQRQGEILDILKVRHNNPQDNVQDGEITPELIKKVLSYLHEHQ